MKIFIFCIAHLLLSMSSLMAQNINPGTDNFEKGKAYMAEAKLNGKDVIKVVMDSTVKLFDEPTFIKLKNIDFKDGTIEVNVLSKFLPAAPDWARGFIGITFRINTDDSKFEGIYIRPDNGRTNDQVRRNHSTQYFSYPNHKFSDFRKTDPEKYESYADMAMNEWIQMKIVVKGEHAELFINNSTQPCLVVNDLKYGANMSGSIGLWVGPGTEGYFSELKISK